MIILKYRCRKEIQTRPTSTFPNIIVYKTDSRKLSIVFNSTAFIKVAVLTTHFFSKSSSTQLSSVWQTQQSSVFICSRERRVAYAADIEAMFNRIYLCPEDAAYHRFLWKEEEDCEGSCYCGGRRKRIGASHHLQDEQTSLR